ncbi:hypothetical protein FFLO_01925 [Filobasidium floriforme]|uniref:NADH-ubiquinone oxidoreductase 21 kDa subunit n=1 Tax=Filobasidium floriforme TaxID=5210 RepID=A0A8K0JNR6_9TREE|nr:NADH-ubiquinone oxidoreductase complex I, 21 kDa subunit-domain-containing protein [Filobasidium floriforme]KAG7562658.1 hypothetical protein FFLO_01925 [Filobasidium floriforme]KAH8089467.1 NADH-ubiquinone oxidoreductase complex I, 21 kDa subunit-domain-containing protein [Filobasidium floriforme]
MPSKQPLSPYPVIDADPTFGRVVRYMRPSDYATWAAAAAAGPAAFWGLERVDPSRASTRSAMKLVGFLGVSAGFLLAYQRSSFRFMGLSENASEAKKDHAELSARVKAGQPIYGETDLTDYVQSVAARNSTWSQLKLSVMPWFNLVNHNYHGVDTSKYGEQK